MEKENRESERSIREYVVERLNEARVDKTMELRETLIKSLQDIARGLYTNRIKDGKTPISGDLLFTAYRKKVVTYLLTYTPLDSEKGDRLEEYVATEAEITMAKAFIDLAIKKMVLLDFQLEENRRSNHGREKTN